MEELEKKETEKFDFDIPDDFDSKRSDSKNKNSNNASKPKEEIEEDIPESPQAASSKKVSNSHKSQKSSEEDYQEEFDDNEGTDKVPSKPKIGQKSSNREQDDDSEDRSGKDDQSSEPEKPYEHNEDDNEKESQEEREGEAQDKQSKPKKRIKFEILIPRSLRLLYDMTAYIGDNEPEDLFNEHIYEQLIKTKKQENMVELISADDFFGVLIEHGLMKEYEEDEKAKEMEKVKDNLMELLWLDPQYKNLLMMKKINKTVNEIIVNEKMQNDARKVHISDDEEEGEESEEEPESAKPQNKELLDTAKKSKTGTVGQKFSARSSSGFSREDEGHSSLKKKSQQKPIQQKIHKEKDKDSDNYDDDDFDKDHSIDNKKGKEQPKAAEKVVSPQKKLEEKEDSIDEEIEDNYEF